MSESQQWLFNGVILFIVFCVYSYFSGMREAHYESYRKKQIESLHEDITKAVEEFAKLSYMDYNTIGAKQIGELTEVEQNWCTKRNQVQIAIYKLRNVL